MVKWQLQEAKNRLSELVRRATEEGPQVITVRGDDAVVVVAVNEFRKLARGPKGSLVDFLRKSPLGKASLPATRSQSARQRLRGSVVRFDRPLDPVIEAQEPPWGS